jgi:hypothetical protein
VAHDGSWIGPDATVTNGSTLERGAQVLGRAVVDHTHLVSTQVNNFAQVFNSRLAKTLVVGHANLSEVFVPGGERESDNVVFAGNAKAYLIMVKPKDSLESVTIAGDANLSGWMHGRSSQGNPQRLIDSGSFTTAEDGALSVIRNGRLVAKNVPGVEPGTIGAQISGTEISNVWADYESTLDDSRLVDCEILSSNISDSWLEGVKVGSSEVVRSEVINADIQRSYIFKSRVFDTKTFMTEVSDSRLVKIDANCCKITDTNAHSWAVLWVDIDKSALNPEGRGKGGHFTGELDNNYSDLRDNTDWFTEVYANGPEYIAVTNCKLVRTSIDSSRGPVEITDVEANTPFTVPAGKWDAQSISALVAKGSGATMPTTAAGMAL